VAQDYYQILGIARKATTEEIQAAFRTLATQVYPGVNRGEAEANARMKEINRAYETLRNTEKRRTYDQTLGVTPTTKPAGSRVNNSGGHSTSSGGVANPLMDVLNAMSNQARVNVGATSDTASIASNSGPVVEIWLTPGEAARGTEKSIKVDGKLIRVKIGIRP